MDCWGQTGLILDNMNPVQKRFTLGIIALGVAGILCWVALSKRVNPENSLTGKEGQNGTSNADQSVRPAVTDVTDVVKPAATNIVPAVEAIISNILPPNNKDKTERMREGLALLNDQEIQFFGKAVDQNGQPVSSADVFGSIIVKNGTTQAVKKVQAATDAQGLFQFMNETGRDLAIVVRKSGYAMSTTNTVFIFSFIWPASQRHHPDSKNPVIFKMWKLQGAEPLVKIDQTYRVGSGEVPVFIDLVAGKQSPGGGDIKIGVQRPSGIVSERNPQDWSLMIEAMDGGLIETSLEESRTTYAAPDDAYVPSHVVKMVFQERTWSGSVQRHFFLKSRNGQVYGKLSLSVRINQNPEDLMVIKLGGIANAHRSRNWEEDPDKIRPPGGL